VRLGALPFRSRGTNAPVRNFKEIIMSYSQSHLPEFDHEMASTRAVLERLPDDKWQWKAHPKSNTIGWNANHIAEIPGWVENMLTQSGFDFNPVGGAPYRTPSLPNRKAVLDAFDKNVAAARKALANAKDSAMGDTWSLLDGGKPIFTMPRAAVMRSMFFNHLIHHRAILTVYFRLNDIPVPGLYGPSGDDKA
jgi:uncharacterized damage-inducible protein DinB